MKTTPEDLLPSRFAYNTLEPGISQRWETAMAFSSHKASSKNPTFSILLPPPNVTGSLHMGHALNATLQDIVARHARMKGRNVLWQPGLDHAGIATQMLVERQIISEGIDPKNLSREDFLQRIWHWKEKHGGIILKQLQKLGMSCDWKRLRFTLDPKANKAVNHAFVALYRKGLITKNDRLVNWDPVLATAISDLEVEMREQKGTLWYIKYPVIGSGEYVVVATTRPETMLADVAVAVHPEDERYKHLHGKRVGLPLTSRDLPIVCDKHVNRDQGSGALKITPSHDFHDFEVAERHQLPIYNIFDKNANILPDTELNARVSQNVKSRREDLFEKGYISKKFLGKSREEARKMILEDLEKKSLLLKEESIVHQVPFSQRSGAIIEPRLSTQWFLDVTTMAQKARQAVETKRTRITPAKWQKNHQRWLKEIRPWCVSRQLIWGHRIPVWYDSEGRKFCAHTQDEAQKQAGQDVPLTQDEDVLDTWFSSALWPLTTLGWPSQTSELKDFYPIDLLITGFDIVFFWVARMMMMSLEHHEKKQVPFKEVYVHALVRDGRGRKMSKSLGNVIDPLVLTQKYGTDALRFTLCAMESQGHDVRLSEQRVAGYRNFTTKIWNACRFCRLNGYPILEHYDLAHPPFFQDMLSRWIVAETTLMLKKAHQSLEERRFNHFADALYHGFWHTFCDWYLEMVKVMVARDPQCEKSETQHIQSVAMWVLETFLHALHPIVPFITEEIWHNMGFQAKRQRLLAQSVWTSEKAFEQSDGLMKSRKTLHALNTMEGLQKCVHQVRSFRIDMGMAPEDKPVVFVTPETAKTIAFYDKRLFCSLARLKIVEERPSHSVQLVTDTMTMLFPLNDEKERTKIKQRLEHQKEATMKAQQRWSAILAADGFVQKAPVDVVDDYRLRLDDARRHHRRLVDALKHL